MEKIKYRLVALRSGKVNQDGRTLIQVEATLNKRKLYLSTHIFVKPDQWDRKKQQVINHILADNYNARLFDFIIYLEQIELGYWKKEIPITLNLLKQAVKTNTSANMTFIDFAKFSTESSNKKSSTKENLFTTIKALSEFRQGITFDDLTYNFIKDFEHHLRAKGCRVNTVGKHLRQLRTLVNEAIKSNYIRLENYPFKNISIKQEKPTHTCLTESEIRRIEKLHLNDCRSNHVRNAFLFCCFTGLRYSDFVSLKTENIQKVGGHTWIQKKMVKTGMEIKIPMDLLFGGKAIGLMQKYESIHNFTNIGGNATVNYMLKLIAEKAGLKKRLHFHCARHTFSTMLISKGVPITTIQKLLGHTSLRMTQLYSEVTASVIIKDLKKIKI